uniref:Protein FAM227B n=1 Tax=Phallusia mammillata TaxID=59560 RepID=A0A6F9DCL9_9ASCI|nr:protein FAM227B [Phallusia mammillata]
MLSSNQSALQNPKIAALMASIGGDASDKKTLSHTIPHPPVTFEEFLESEKVNEWPQRLTSEGILDVSEMSHSLWTLDDIKQDLLKSAPFGLDNLIDMEERMNEFSERLDYFSTYITSPDERPSRIPDNLFHAPKKEDLEKAGQLDAVKLHHSRRKKKKDMKQTMQEAAQASRTRNIEYITFPGFRPKELTELPSQLEAPQLLNRITEAQTFNKGFLKMWKKLFLSEGSVALLQDIFWWFFLENFEHNPHAQDRIFTRIADSYVAVFFSAHPDIRDKFMLEFPRCMAQAVYLTFCEAFPESHDRFTEEFVSELAFLISEWSTGVRSPVDEWKKWPWSKLGVNPGNMGDGMASTDHEGALAMRGAAEVTRDMSFDVDALLPSVDLAPPSGTDELPEILVGLADEEGTAQPKKSTGDPGSRQDSHPKSAVRSLRQQKQRSMSLTNSAQAGPGPDFERVLFNLGGRSPLVAHHLYFKHLKDKDSVGKSMRRTEVLQLPAPGVTFQDVIAKSKKTVRSLHAQRERSLESLQADVAKVRKAKRVAVREIQQLQESLKDPLEIKIRSDKVLDQALERGIHRASTYGGSKSSLTQQPDLIKDDFNDNGQFPS